MYFDPQFLVFSSVDICGESETQCSDDAVCTQNGCCVCDTGYYGNGKMCLKKGTSLSRHFPWNYFHIRKYWNAIEVIYENSVFLSFR
jgi:hypothetical protein